jgi:hypothetical protein
LRIISGVEPTNVKLPPILAKNPQGIMVFDAGILLSLLTLRAAGSITATAPTLDIMADGNVTARPSKVITLDSLLPAIVVIFWAILLTTPVLSSAVPITMTQIRTITALDPSPVIASLTERRPVNGSTVITSNPTTSTRRILKTNRITTKPKTEKTTTISVVRARGSIAFLPYNEDILSNKVFKVFEIKADIKLIHATYLTLAGTVKSESLKMSLWKNIWGRSLI